MEFDCKIKGGHRQATREGDNLLDFNVTQDSRVTVNEDGTITITGKGGFTLALKRFTAKANTKYYIKWELVSGTVDTSKSNGNSFLNPLDNTNIKQGEFKESVVENDKDINGFWIKNMAVFTNAVIKFWANTNKNDFEQYGASPSPDYPSEIETVGSNVNLFDKDNVNKLSGYIDKSGYLQYDTNNKIIYVKCEANTDYVISSKNIRGVAFLNKVPRIGLESTNFKILTTTELTLNSKENTYLACWYYSSKLSLTEQEILNSIKIEKGTVATAYSLYNQGSVKMDVVNKNLLNMQKKETSWTGAKVVTENNKVTFIGASNGTLGMSYNSYEEKIKLFDKVLHEEMEDTTWQPTYFEKPFEFVWDNKAILKGFIDRIDVKDGQYRTVDYKTSKKIYDQSKLATSLQFGIYALAILNEFGELPIESQYRFILIDDEQYALTKGWEKRLIKALDKVFGDIEASENKKLFIPKPTPLCHWCNFCTTNPEATIYKNECEYYSKWTPTQKTFEVNKKWNALENNNTEKKRKLVF